VYLSSSENLTAGGQHARMESGTDKNTVIAVNSLSQTTVRRHTNAGGSENFYIEKRKFVAVFAGQTTVNVGHILKYDPMPFEFFRFHFSSPPPSFPVLALVTENTFSVSFSGPYTGTVSMILSE
jgi:hypothetical protein